MLTHRQSSLLTFLDERIRSDGVAPSFEEMQSELDLRSKASIHRLLASLEERGYVRRLHHKARAIEVLKPPIKSIAEFRRISRNAEHGHTLCIPSAGQLATGLSPGHLRFGQSLVVPASYIEPGLDYVAFGMGDTSMTGAGIFVSDNVVIARGSELADGAIMLIAIADRLMLRKISLVAGSVVATPSNDSFETVEALRADVKVLGRMRALLRRY